MFNEKTFLLPLDILDRIFDQIRPNGMFAIAKKQPSTNQINFWHFPNWASIWKSKETQIVWKYGFDSFEPCKSP